MRRRMCRSRASLQPIGPAAAVQRIVAAEALQQIVLGAALKNVVALRTHDVSHGMSPPAPLRGEHPTAEIIRVGSDARRSTRSDELISAWSTQFCMAGRMGRPWRALSVTNGSRRRGKAPAGSGWRRNARRSRRTPSSGAVLIARFTEVESGRDADRPELAKALHLAKVTGATLVIAKLDRLSRNAAFLLALRDSGVRFSAVDLPEANDLTVGIMALVAQQEREAISRRTKEALAVARERGVRLGNPNGVAALLRAGKGTAPLRAAIAGNAERHARDLAPVVADIRSGGAPASGDRRGAECARHAHAARRALAQSTVINLLDRLGLREGGMRQSRADVARRGAGQCRGRLWRGGRTQLLVFPMFGLRTTLGENLAIGAVFTGVSLVRNYALRRLFEAIRVQR